MNEVLEYLIRHGYAILFAAVFLEQAGDDAHGTPQHNEPRPGPLVSAIVCLIFRHCPREKPYTAVACPKGCPM